MGKKDKASAAEAPDVEKPLPSPIPIPARPGTSGTEYVQPLLQPFSLPAPEVPNLSPLDFLHKFSILSFRTFQTLNINRSSHLFRLKLRADRRAASSAFQRAQRAEAAYRAKRQATAAKTNLQSSRAHFKASFTSFKLGCQFLWGGIGALS
jgi:hypothetical protein